MHTPAHNSEPGPAQPGPLPNGLYVREENEGPDQTAGQGEDAGLQVTWSITGLNPEFWWDINVTRLGADTGGIELHCTRCGIRDQADSMDDLLRLIRAKAHFHGTDPVGEP